MNKIFSLDISSQRVVLYLLGIRFRYLKKEYRNKNKEYTNLNCPVNEIPQATGVLRKIQLSHLKLLKEFQIICEENSLNFGLILEHYSVQSDTKALYLGMMMLISA